MTTFHPLRKNALFHPALWIVAGVLGIAPNLRAAPLTVEEAIRRAWRDNPGLASGASMLAAARADAESARDQRLPTLQTQLKAVATNEPVAAFGMRLDQKRITAADFDPSRLNSPDAIGGIGASVGVMQPLYMGGKLTAGRRAAEENAAAEEAAQQRRLHEMAFHVVQAYFGAQVAAHALDYAADVLAQAKETEAFTRSRNEQGLALDADVARVTAFRAGAEAEHAQALQRLASARSALALMVGQDAATAELTTPLVAETPTVATSPDERSDLRAARLRADAANQMASVVRANLLPQVMAQASLATLRSNYDQGATWFALGVVAQWNLSLADSKAETAAKQRALAAREMLLWQTLQAKHEASEAERAFQSAKSRIVSAREAVAASESARALRRDRHRQGLLPLTEVLDAEAALAGARALLLRTEFDVRVAIAEQALALGQPIEGVSP